MTLTFDKEKLANCISKQLNMVAELSQNNTIVVQAGGAPYLIPTDKPNDKLENDVLTTVTDYTGDKNKKVVGHAILKFKEGGYMIISAGHWIQLQQVNVSMETLERVAVSNYGNDYAQEFENIKNNVNTSNSVSNVCDEDTRERRQNKKQVQRFDNSNYIQSENLSNCEEKEECAFDDMSYGMQNMNIQSSMSNNASQSEQVNRLAMKFIQQTAPCNYTKKKK